MCFSTPLLLNPTDVDPVSQLRVCSYQCERLLAFLFSVSCLFSLKGASESVGMRVALEPSANPALPGDGAAAAACTPPQKHKPLLQARRNQYEDYRNLKDRDFLSLHEEVTHLRQSTKDQERIIVLLKEEKNRVLADLLQKSKDLQHCRDLMGKPGFLSPEEKAQLQDLKRTLADREATIDDLKGELIRINGTHQRALDDYDEVLSQLRTQEQDMLTAKQTAEHKTAECARLEESIRILNEEMQTRMRDFAKELDRAAEVGKRDASVESRMLDEDRDQWKRKYAEAQATIKRLQDDEQRLRESALTQQQAANDANAEKVQLLAEIRRQKVLLAELEELKVQVAHFRETQVASEALLREKLNVALVDIHDEKALTRQLMAEVDRKDDIIAGKDRDIARITREYEEKLDAAHSEPSSKGRKMIEELEQLLRAAQQEKIVHVEHATRFSVKCDALERQLADRQREISDLKEDLKAASANRAAVEQRSSELEETVAHLQRALSSALSSATTTAQTVGREERRVEREALESERAALLQQVAERERQAELIRQTADSALTEASARIHALECQVDALRDAQTESDAVRHESLARQLEERDAEIQALHFQSNAAAEVIETLQAASQRLQVASSPNLPETCEQSSQTEPEVDVSGDIAADTDRGKIAELESAITSLTQQLQESTTAAQQTVADAIAPMKKQVERLEREKKQLTEKLKASESAVEDLTKSLEVRAQQLRLETQARVDAGNELKRAQDALKSAEVTHSDERQSFAREAELLQSQLVELERRSTVSDAELKKQIADLTEANERMRNIQMHW